MAGQQGLAAEDTNSASARALAKADKLFKEQNWAEARVAYEQLSAAETIEDLGNDLKFARPTVAIVKKNEDPALKKVVRRNGGIDFADVQDDQ